MTPFQSVTLEWEGKRYTIPADKMFGAIGAIEEHYTLAELSRDSSQRDTVRLKKLCSAYAALLTYAAAGTLTVTGEEIFNKAFLPKSTVPSNVVYDAVQMLLVIMTPPDALKAFAEANPKSNTAKLVAEVTPPNVFRNRRMRRAERSSRKHSKPRGTGE